MSARPDPLRALHDSFAVQMQLCDELERVADSLPGRADRQLCLHLARQIGRIVHDAHAVEESLLFPSVLSRHRNGAAVVERLRLEHLEDECFAEEVQYELLRLGEGTSALTPEATGYMLRGFFECRRRHVRHGSVLLEIVSPSRP